MIDLRNVKLRDAYKSCVMNPNLFLIMIFKHLCFWSGDNNKSKYRGFEFTKIKQIEDYDNSIDLGCGEDYRIWVDISSKVTIGFPTGYVGSNEAIY